jgi:hypothetical protein
MLRGLCTKEDSTTGIYVSDGEPAVGQLIYFVAEIAMHALYLLPARLEIAVGTCTDEAGAVPALQACIITEPLEHPSSVDVIASFCRRCLVRETFSVRLYDLHWCLNSSKRFSESTNHYICEW